MKRALTTAMDRAVRMLSTSYRTIAKEAGVSADTVIRMHTSETVNTQWPVAESVVTALRDRLQSEIAAKTADIETLRAEIRANLADIETLNAADAALQAAYKSTYPRRGRED